MKISVSQIKRHVECPMKAHFEYTLLRGTEKRPLALDVGSLVHVAMEAKLKGEPNWMGRCEELLISLPSEAIEETTAAFNSLVPALKLWSAPDDWEIVSVEEELEVPCGQHTLVGRLDCVVRWNGLFWHLQHKTLSPSIPVNVYCEQQRTDWHECVYHSMAEAKGYRPFGGTILNIIRKLSAKRIAENPADATVPPQFLPRTSESIQEAMADLSQLIDTIEAGRDGKCRIIKQRNSCGGLFRNSLCIYKPVCDGDASIESEMYVDLEPRYDADV